MLYSRRGIIFEIFFIFVIFYLIIIIVDLIIAKVACDGFMKIKRICGQENIVKYLRWLGLPVTIPIQFARQKRQYRNSICASYVNFDMKRDVYENVRVVVCDCDIERILLWHEVGHVKTLDICEDWNDEYLAWRWALDEAFKRGYTSVVKDICEWIEDKIEKNNDQHYRDKDEYYAQWERALVEFGKFERRHLKIRNKKD